MEFAGDAFISYAHLDNVELVEGRKGWVANFHRALEVRVGQLLGKKPQIWRDPKLSGNDLFEETLIDRLKQVARPRLGRVAALPEVRVDASRAERVLASCRRTGRHSCQRQGPRLQGAQDAGAARSAHRPSCEPSRLRVLQSRSGDRKVRELDEVFGPEAQRDFWLKLDDLAHDICRSARSARSTPEISPAAPAAAGEAPSRLPRRNDQRPPRAAGSHQARPPAARLHGAAAIGAAASSPRRCRSCDSRRSGADARMSIHSSARTTASCRKAARSRSSKFRTSSRSNAPGRADSRACSGFRADCRSRTERQQKVDRAAPDGSAHRHGRRSARNVLRRSADGDARLAEGANDRRAPLPRRRRRHRRRSRSGRLPDRGPARRRRARRLG